ncbi:hypothetical protein LEP1GSC193_0931 [Leptospira alstonii serovar Pingchang str. 80-412]|uniref:Uncharacterized protein n=3 Tax=Leptospira alstonii TaxID=28452 RepID=M6D2H9_9LEPT|nr:hypothetical protein LEP1GSC194_3710 [Leptospira alstonii serovar Sichuan str. 79601]EQA80098.1 hypothetical protein LEP1GSC193_0931 [Leptospira alstonii serovar Pingchang str. 80-412]
MIGEFVAFIQSDFAIRHLSDISKVLYEYQRSSKYYRAKDKFCNYIMETCRIVLNIKSFNSVEQWGDLIQEKAFEIIFQKECLFRQEAKELRERAKELRFEFIPEDVYKKNLGWWKDLGPFRRVYKEFGIQSSDEDLTG